MNKELEQTLHDILSFSRELKLCLEKENMALTSKNFDELLSIAEAKQLLVEQLNELDKQRASFSSTPDFSRYLKNIDPEGQLSRQWKAIQSNIAECQHKNEVNGRLLQRQNRLNRETMELLTGRKLSQETTYGPDGMQSGHKPMLQNLEV